MIVRVTPHLPSPSPLPSPQRRANEPVIAELVDDRDVSIAPSSRRVRLVNDLESASNGRRDRLAIDGPSQRQLFRRPVSAVPSERRVAFTNVRHVRVTMARTTRAATALGVFGSGRMFFGALDLYIAPHRRVDAESGTSA